VETSCGRVHVLSTEWTTSHCLTYVTMQEHAVTWSAQLRRLFQTSTRRNATIVKGNHILIFLLVSISLQTCIHFKAEQKASRQKEGDSTENDAVNTLPTKARAVRAPAQEEKKETPPACESLLIPAVCPARSLYRRARDLSISQRASRCAPWLCMLEPWTAPRPCLTSCDALRSTSCGRWRVQTRRTPALRSTSAGK